MNDIIPIIFWIHSPIGFESYKAFSKRYCKGPIFTATSRSINIENSIFQIGSPGLYQNQNLLEISKTSKLITGSLSNIINTYEKYILIAPQSSQPYIKALIDTDYCKGYLYYDEGSACYIDNIENMRLPIHHQYELAQNIYFDQMLEFLKIDEEDFKSNYKRGVSFYNFNDIKYLGCMSFFDNAFPGQYPKLLKSSVSMFEKLKCSEYNIILANDMRNGSAFYSEENMHFNNINNISKFLGPKTIIKTHPSDNESDVISNIDSNLIPWSLFCTINGINPASETAFLEFKLYVTSNNSTSLYLNNMKRRNYISIY